MVHIEIDTGVREYTVTVTGHAGYAEKGKDIVCAGVSALFMGLCGAAEGQDIVTFENETEGAWRLRFYKTSEARDYLRVFREGVRRVADEYPDYCALYVNGEKYQTPVC